MRILVTGGRDFTDRAMIRLALKDADPKTDVLVHGAATGADTLAAEQWEAWGGKTEPHPADWKNLGRGAGPIRNQAMLNTGVDVLIAFPGGRGTADMTRRALYAGLPVIYADQIPIIAASSPEASHERLRGTLPRPRPPA